MLLFGNGKYLNEKWGGWEFIGMSKNIDTYASANNCNHTSIIFI